MAIDLSLSGRVLTVTVNGESASIDLANIRGDDGVRGPQGPAGDASSVTALESTLRAHTEAANPHSGSMPETGGTFTGSVVVGGEDNTGWLAVVLRRLVGDDLYTSTVSLSSAGDVELTKKKAGANENYMLLKAQETQFGKPVSVTGGGTGCATEAELRTYLKALLGLS